MIVTDLLKHREIAKEILLVYQIMKKTTYSFTKQVIVDKFVNNLLRKDVTVKRELRFIDSLRFMTASLHKLSSNLQN